MGEKTRLSGINLFFLWFGASVSVAEILTGGYLAELGAVKGFWAILLGHLAGTLLLVLAGLIGFREKVPAIMSTRISFGKQGSYLISVINILQLVGWTAIMIIEGGTAMNVIAVSLWHFNHPNLMSCLVGFLVGLWVFWGVKGFKRINTLASALLLVLT
ncbi:MAG: cytosine permease, partial [Deltaproteobacteria bacterium]|nr:cytosine permease [Deltaproteobacteria bacterium]